MTLNFTMNKTTLIVSVKGDIDQHSAASLREQIDLRLTHDNVRSLVFDFTSLDFMDSSGIGIIIGRYKIMSALDGKITIATDKSVIVRLLELSGVTRLIKICPTLSEAMKI